MKLNIIVPSNSHFRDHAFQGTPVYAGAGYVADLLKLAEQKAIALDQLTFTSPLILPENRSPSIEFEVSEFRIVAIREDGMELCRAVPTKSNIRPEGSALLSKLQSSTISQSYSEDEIYKGFTACSNEYGPAYQSLETIQVSQVGKSMCGLALLKSSLHADVLLDSAVQAVAQCNTL